MYKNAEGYSDPTPGEAMSNIRREQRQQEVAERLAVISRLIPVMKQTAELAGFEVVGRITLKDKETGKELNTGKNGTSTRSRYRRGRFRSAYAATF